MKLALLSAARDARAHTLHLKPGVVVPVGVLLALLLVPLARSQSNNPSGILRRDTKASSRAQEQKSGSHKVDQLRAAARREPRSAQVHNELGLALGELGDLNGAAAEVETS